jgi:hypothetical protein
LQKQKWYTRGKVIVRGDVLMSDTQHYGNGFLPTVEERRWYEQDALLSEVLKLLSEYPEEFKAEAGEFLEKLEGEVGAEVVEGFYAEAKRQSGKGKRWYDGDATLFKAIELLRVLPPVVQRQAAERFLGMLKQ